MTHLSKNEIAISRKELINMLTSYFNPTEEDLNDLLSNGTPRFVGNINWAVVYLKKAELIEYVDKGVYCISDTGRVFLQENPQFDWKTIKEIPALQKWKTQGRGSKSDIQNNDESDILEQEDNSTVISATEDYYEFVEMELLKIMKNMGSHTIDKRMIFENICLELLEKMGYGIAERTGGSGDKGIDGFLTTDRFGFDRIGIQCKCHSDNKITDDQITKFAHGLKNVNGLNKGIFISTTDYTPSARKVVNELKDIKIILINGQQLARYMREYQIVVSVVVTNYVYDITLSDNI